MMEGVAGGRRGVLSEPGHYSEQLRTWHKSVEALPEGTCRIKLPRVILGDCDGSNYSDSNNNGRTNPIVQQYIAIAAIIVNTHVLSLCYL